jgi:hypothetical protein
LTEPTERPAAELILYQTEDHRTRVDVRLSDGTVWLTQAQMAELFQTTVANVNIHLKSILKTLSWNEIELLSPT